MQYKYYLAYDKEKDDFFGVVDENYDDRDSDPIFEIGSTAEMLEYLKTGVMKHLDDVEGLTAFLKKQETIKPEDTITLERVLR